MFNIFGLSFVSSFVQHITTNEKLWKCINIGKWKALCERNVNADYQNNNKRTKQKTQYNASIRNKQKYVTVHI